MRPTLGEDVITALGRGAFEDRQEANAGHAGGGLQAGGGQHGRTEVLTAEQGRGITARSHDAGPAHDEGDVATRIIERTLAVRQRLAVVTGEDDEGVLRESETIEQREHLAGSLVDAVHLGAIIGILLAHARQVGHVGREFERRRIGTIAERSRPRMVRVAEVHPEAEGLVLRTALKESRGLLDCLRIGAALHDVETVREGLVTAFHQELTELAVGLPHRTIEVIGSSDHADIIAGLLLEDFREGDHIPGQRRREARDAGSHR